MVCLGYFACHSPLTTTVYDLQSFFILYKHSVSSLSLGMITQSFSMTSVFLFLLNARLSRRYLVSSYDLGVSFALVSFLMFCVLQ